MPFFVIQYAMGAGGLRSAGDKYRAAQADRKAFRLGLGDRLLLAGPIFKNSRDEDAVASMMIIEATDKSDAIATAREHPYYKVGEFQNFTVHEIALTVFNNQFKLQS